MTIDSLDETFRLETEVTKVGCGSLLSLENPKYSEVIQEYPHLTCTQMKDQNDNLKLTVHIILGVSNYEEIRTETRPKIGSCGEPIAELTKFGCTIKLPVKIEDISCMLPTQTAAADYEQCCKLYMLGILYTAIGGQADAYRVQKAVNFKRGGLVQDRSALERKPSCPTQQQGGMLETSRKYV